MFRRLKHLYRIDTVPWSIRPAYLLYGYGLGWLLYGFFRVLSWTLQIERIGKERLPKNFIYALWHHHGVSFFVCVDELSGFIGLNHPAWYMKPAHVTLSLLGIENVLGSTGNDGREASSFVVEAVRNGRSSFVTPDGPAGPRLVLRKGVLHMAAQSGVPVVPLSFKYSRCVRLRGWDRKFVPIPFSRVVVVYHPAVYVSEGRFEEAEREIVERLQ